MYNLDAIDISETGLRDLDPETLEQLLRDHTTGRHILWCTDDYASLGEGYLAEDEITARCITGEHERLIRPRALKNADTQRDRTKERGEVFTPASVCNLQNNLIDEAWFGRKDVFNHANDDLTWTVNPNPVTFPEGKTWKDYVRDTRLEIACGEAPYLVSRYDTTTGRPIAPARRIGLLDRKLRVINEQVDNRAEWLKWVQTAYQHVYAYEWQGDNLLLAREALLQTFMEYHAIKFGTDYPLRPESLRYIAYIISWNVFQMDGLKGVVPGSCGKRQIIVRDLFGETVRTESCQGCQTGDLRRHNGTYAMIKDWTCGAKDPKRKQRFIDLMKQNG